MSIFSVSFAAKHSTPTSQNWTLVNELPDKYASCRRCFKVGHNTLSTASKSLLYQLWLWSWINSPKRSFAGLFLWSWNFYKKPI